MTNTAIPSDIPDKPADDFMLSLGFKQSPYMSDTWVKIVDGWEFDLSNREARFIESLVQEQVAETEKAYGGCHNCYGKGYSTVIDSTIAYADFGNELGGAAYKKTEKLTMKFCTCERGKQLKTLTKQEANK